MKKELLIFLSIFMSILLIFNMGSYIYNEIYAQRLNSAIESNDLKRLEKLLNKNGNIDAKPYLLAIDRPNFPALHTACRLGNFEAVIMLVEYGADVNNIKSNNKTSPLLASLNNNNSNRFEIAEYLIDRGANIHYKNFHSDTAVSIGLSISTSKDDEQKQFDFTVELIKKGVNIEETGHYGHLIYYAAVRNNVLLIEYLLNVKEVDVNLQNEAGYTALIFASRGDCIEAVEYLLQNNADKDLKNRDKKTALDIALEYNNEEVIKLLEK